MYMDTFQIRVQYYCGGCLNNLQQDDKFIVGLGQQRYSDCFCRAVHD